MNYKKYLAKGYLWFLLAVLYTPIIIIAIFSFTETKVLGNWTGFSLKLYTNLFEGRMSDSLISAIQNTVVIAIIASVLATILGSIAAIGIYNLRSRQRHAVTFLNNIPLINPDIITGISLFLLFVALGVSHLDADNRGFGHRIRHRIPLHYGCCQRHRYRGL